MHVAPASGERTGWRDEALSLRHRRWGFNLPGADLDFVLLEYHLSKPVALIEYKHHRSAWPNLGHPNYLALRDLADRDPQLPFFIARYWPETWAFQLLPGNDLARRTIGGADQIRCSERAYVQLLHSLRALKVQEQVIARLNTTPPPPRLTLVK